MRTRGNLAFRWLAVGLVLASAAANLAHCHSQERFVFRRQSPPAGATEKEKESTTAAGEQPARLYPDLPRPPEVDPFGAGSAQHNHPVGGFGGAPTAFIPSFGGPPPAGHVPGSPFFRMQTIRPAPALTPAERHQSATFTSGLGARLLAMMGIKSPEPRSLSSSSAPWNNDGQPEVGQAGSGLVALQNATVLSQLNKGVHTIYGSLSRMYNTTVQQQLNLLQERFNREMENNTSAGWQQRMAKQVPEFFKQVAARVNEAQENLNKVVRQVGQTINNSSALEGFEGARASTRHFFDQFGDQFAEFHPNNFFNQFNGGDPAASGPAQPPTSLANRMRMFWHEQVQPQIGFVRNQMNRVWRELSANGLLAQPDHFGNRMAGNPNNNASSSSDLVDDILKSVDVTSPDFVLFETQGPREPAAKAERLQQAASEPHHQEVGQQTNRSSQAIAHSQQIIQSGLVSAQRELNQLWSGLSSSLQATMARVGSMLRPRQNQFPPAPQNNQPDPAENEIEGRLKELGKLQRDADGVYETVQRQQQQQRSAFGDNFRHLFHQFNEQLEHIPARFGDSVNRLGTAVNDLWGQLPGRWNNFVDNIRPQPEVARSQPPPASSTAKPA